MKTDTSFAGISCFGSSTLPSTISHPTATLTIDRKQHGTSLPTAPLVLALPLYIPVPEQSLLTKTIHEQCTCN